MAKTFPKGGVHPNDNKLSKDSSIEKLPIPQTAYIPISQHIGAPASPVVNINDKVKVGQLIAKQEGFVSANIHSSVSGTVVKIDDFMDTCGYKRKTIVINVEDDVWQEEIDRNDSLKKDINFNAEEIKEKIVSSGIVGLGGATFPSHVKLSIPQGKKAEYLIINGVECEPFLTSDHRLMLEKGHEIMVGIQILMKVIDVNKALIGIENNKPDVIKYLTEISKEHTNVEVYSLKVQYPQGGEKQLVKALLNREVPSPPGLPIDVGCVVHNVGTVYAIYEAVEKNKPLFERVVTVTGKSLKKPSNYLVRIGTPVSELIQAAGGLPEDTGKIISGGPMMGKAVNSLDIPVTKSTSGIVMVPEKESKRQTMINCIRCSRCVFACPQGLEPYLLMTLSQKELFEEVKNRNILSCIECGCCMYVCPADRTLLDYIRLGKTTVMKMLREAKK